MKQDNTGQPEKNQAFRPAANGIPSSVHSNKGDDYAKTNLIDIPSISLPKGGGALKSIDEKFQVNAANGTSTFSIAIPLSKSRSEFAPVLSLNYNSGGGNSPFGLGWNISLPAIRRRTDKLLPAYKDADSSDIFQLAGVEDLVPTLHDGAGGWKPDISTSGNYLIRRFRPRLEAAFTLIEQVTSPVGMYWKTTAKDNTVTFFGLSAEGRVANPGDPSQVYEWLPQLSYDDKGNCFQFFYVAEDLTNVPVLLHEGNRLNGNQGIANCYLKRIAWGNASPYDPVAAGATPDPYSPVVPDGTGYLFSLILDYGDHDPDKPVMTPSTPWGSRLDPFSNYKPGFDMRTYRLCRRFLIFHLFPELDSNPVVVRSLDLNYKYYDFQSVADPYTLNFVEADFITSATETGWVGTETLGYQRYSLPACTFFYQLPVWNTDVKTVDAQNRVNIPDGLVPPYQFTDLYNEGIAGILSEQSEGWYYNSNLGDGVFTAAGLVSPKPSFSGIADGSLQLTSLTGDGRKFIVSPHPPVQGYFELTDGQEWRPFEAFDRYPAIDGSNPYIRYIDLNGDGMPEIVLSEEQIFTWYPAAGISGYDSPEIAQKPFDEEKGPAIVFADPVESVFLADMTGDGLTDIVRIRNAEISYWPNLGYGLFGAKVNMTNAPLFDTIDGFNPVYLHLADINGTGATDILYLGQDRLRVWLNLSGNAWGDPFEVPAFSDTTSPNQLSVIDFLGNGTACIVWSSPLGINADTPMRYIDLMGGNKPYLMSGYTNGMGMQASINYKSSTYFYLQDKLAGTPWITKLCFPVQCVDNIQITDAVSGTHYSSSYTYHHGYFDHHEKEYRGFGRVEQTDTDLFNTNAKADQAPVLTKTWFHTGAWFGMERILHYLASEYFHNPLFKEYNLPEPELPIGLTTDQALEGVRACKGMVLRQEVYALDGDLDPTLAPYPYTVAEHNNHITMLQPRGDSLYAVFLSTESEQITYEYDRHPADPRIAHTLNTAFDVYGNVVDSYAVVYARQPVDPANPGGITLPGGQPLPAVVSDAQQVTSILYTHHAYTGDFVDALVYRLRVACETIAYQLTGISPAAGYYRIADFTNPSASSTLTKLKHQRTLCLKDDLVTPLPLYSMDTLGLVYQQYHLAFDASVTALGGKATDAMLKEGRYVASDDLIGTLFPASDPNGEWWVPSGRIVYLNAGVALPFLLPHQVLDSFGYATTLGYDAHWLLLSTVTDAIGNAITATPIDYRVLAPQTTTDQNGNATDYKYDGLGLVVAVAMRGKGEGDVFDAAFTNDLSPAQVTGFFGDPFTNGPTLLQGATMRYIYDFVSGGPFSTGTIARKMHTNQIPESWVSAPSLPYQFSFEYTDSLGRMAMTKIQADANTVTATADSCDDGGTPVHRWIGNGKTIFNNKGKPVMQYEPFFSDTPAYEDAPLNGVTAVIHYDPIGRVIRTDLPDGTYSKTDYDPWLQIVYDANDTVKTSQWYQDHSTSSDPREVDAVTKAAAHDNTPSAVHLDPFGRSFYTVAYNLTTGIAAFYATLVVLDVQNRPMTVIDAMGNTVMTWDYDLLDRQLHQFSMDAGERWELRDAMNNPFSKWDQNGVHHFQYSYTYDLLHRPLQSGVIIDGVSYLIAYNVYGEGVSVHGAADTTNNLRGKVYRQFDQSGVLTHYRFDFKNNLLQSSRIFARTVMAANPLLPAVLWTGADSDTSLLATEEYMTVTCFDALNRPILYSRPFISSSPGAVIVLPYTQASVGNADLFVPGYGESGPLNTLDLYYRGGSTATPYVTRICHNEKRQRLCIQYGNNTVTRYSYDPDTFRMTRLLTTVSRGTTILQDLNYYYDPVGNITYRLDNAQPPVFYNNQKVLSDGNYTYDAIYRLIAAGGREQIAQNSVDERPSNMNERNYPFDVVPLPAPGDALAMRNYTQTYQYDAVGNMLQLQHAAGTGSYTRRFVYNNTPVRSGANNQLLSTVVGAGPAVGYTYDAHGNMLNLPVLPAMGWNYQDQFAAATQQAVGAGTGMTTWYAYDAGGQRIRKVTMSAASAGHAAVVVSERLYLGDFELYRSFDGSGNVTLQRETLHVSDHGGRIALIDKKTIDSAGGDSTTLNTYYPRYQYSDHLGSAAIELDASGKIISYEEYHPFGTSSFQAMDGALDVPLKRYRYTGKERDEESGLYYHGARYYAPWLCRWTSADPIGIEAGVNVYEYVKNSPIILIDPKGTEDKKPQQKEMSVLESVGSYLSFEFYMTTGQTPEAFGMGIVHKFTTPVVGIAKSGYGIYGPKGMIDKAASKAVDLAQGKKPEEPTEDEHKQMLNDIINVGGSLFPGFGELEIAAPRPSLAPAGGGVLPQAVELAVPNELTKAPAQAMAAYNAGGGKQPKEKAAVAKKSYKEPGKWGYEMGAGTNMTEEQAAYQTQITKQPAEKTYFVNGRAFDGFERGVNGAPDKLLEAKYLEDEGRFAKAYENMKKGNYSDINNLVDRGEKLLDQARAQIEAAEGTGAQIEWRVSGEKATQALQKLFDNYFPGKIKVVNIPKIP